MNQQSLGNSVYSQDITIITIDEEAIEKYGQWFITVDERKIWSMI